MEEVEIIKITLIKPIPPLSTTPGNTWIVNASKINKVNKTTKWADNLTSFSLVSIEPRISKINPKADINEFCPALAPYIGQYTLSTKNGTASTGVGPLNLELFNTSINPYTIVIVEKNTVYFVNRPIW